MPQNPRPDLIVTSIHEYAEHLELHVDFEETGDDNLMPMDEANSIAAIIACEVAIYLMRRTAVCGTNVKHMNSLWTALVSGHDERYEKSYQYVNRNCDW